MTKYEWERQLKKGISGLPKSEQQRVLDYYNELFADKIDAGLREQYIISEFGNPYDVANKILVDFYNDGKENPAVDEYIYSTSDEIDEAFDDAPTNAVVETPKRKTWTERREERKISHGERVNEVYADTIEYNTDEPKDGKTKKKGKGGKSASGLIVLICVLIYCVLGACFNLWHPAWLIFLIIPCVTSLIAAINRRNWRLFAYPLFATSIFLALGFFANMWHPGWIIFITIPIYYVLGDFITKNADGNKTKKSDKLSVEDDAVQQPKNKENVKKEKKSKSENTANVLSIIAKVLMTICFVWLSIVVWSFVLSLFVGGIGLMIGGIASFVAATANGVDMLVIGIGLAQLGLGVVCTFGMVALFKPCINMCKSFVKTIKNSFDGKENA